MATPKKYKQRLDYNNLPPNTHPDDFEVIWHNLSTGSRVVKVKGTGSQYLLKRGYWDRINWSNNREV